MTEQSTPASPPWCRHRGEYPEHTIWPDHAALQHFDLCLTQEQRKAHFSRLREAAERGTQCWLMDHDGYGEQVASLHRALDRYVAVERFKQRHGPAYRKRQLARRARSRRRR